MADNEKFSTPPETTRASVAGRTPASGRTSVAGQTPASGRTSVAGRAPVSGQTHVSGRTPVSGRTSAPVSAKTSKASFRSEVHTDIDTGTKHHDVIQVEPDYQLETPSAANAPSYLKTLFQDQSTKFLFFNDGKRRVDYVIVIEDKETENDTSWGVFSTKETDPQKQQRADWRNTFIKGLVRHGVRIEKLRGQYRLHTSYIFLKLHAPWDTLTGIAEKLALQMPLAPDAIRLRAKVDTAFSWFKGKDEPKEEQPRSYDKNKEVVTSPFCAARVKQFNIPDKDTFFSPAQRSLMMHYILTRVVFDPGSESRSGKFGIDELISVGAASAAYPMHSAEVKHVFDFKKLLRGTWSYFLKKEASLQLDQVRVYFGEKMGFFFCFFIFYTNMLIAPTVFGLICLLYGISAASSMDYVKEICTTKDSKPMCPSGCLDCDPDCKDTFPKLSESCDIAEIAAIVDNDALIANTIFVTLWTIVMMKLWIRRMNVLQIYWHVRDFKSQEALRPQLYTFTKEQRKHPITDEPEPYVSFNDKVYRRSCSALAMMVMIGAVILMNYILGLISEEIECAAGKTINIIVGSFLSLFVVVMFAKLYGRVSTILTNFELQRTESDWENSFRLKYFLFCFINSNTGPFLIILINPYLSDDAQITGDSFTVALLLMIYMIGEPTVLFLVEVIQAKIQFYRTVKADRIDKEEWKKIPDGEKDFQLEEFPTDLLTEFYSDLMIQYGYVTMYAANFPVSAAFAIIRNLLSMRRLYTQLSVQWRRPIAERSQDIGIYYDLMRFISYLAVFVNAVSIATKTQFIPMLVYETWKEEYSRSESYIGFRLEPGSGFDEFCYVDFKTKLPDQDRSREYYKTSNKGLVFAIIFVFIVVILSTIMYKVPNIPKKEYLDEARQQHLANKVLQQYLTKGEVKKGDTDDTAKDTGLMGNLYVGEKETAAKTATGLMNKAKAMTGMEEKPPESVSSQALSYVGMSGNKKKK